LSKIYLVRHGQAGTRDAYDTLSALGRRQSKLLGEYFVTQEIQFSSVYAGTMQRQQLTAAEVIAAYANSDLPLPEVNVDKQWNEFDLANVYRVLGPLLCEAEPVFRREYEEMVQEVKENSNNPASQVHRRWRPCDTRMVEAWIEGKLPYDGETWNQFRERVVKSGLAIPNEGPQENVLVFTSATPTGILTGLALDIQDTRVRQLAGVLYNSSFTVLRHGMDQLRLFQFNSIPHLLDRELQTHR